MAAGPKRSILKEVVEVLRDRAFRPWLVFICLWNFAMTLCASLAAVYFVETLFERSLLFGILAASVVPLAMGVLTSRRMGALVDRFGARTVLRFGHLIWTLVPLPWVFATPATAVWLVAGSNILGMPAINAATNAAIKYVTRFATSEKRAMYWAVSSSLASLAGGLGAVVTGEALEFLRGWSVDVAGWTLSGFRAVFVASIALRFVAALFTWRLPAPPAEQAGR